MTNDQRDGSLDALRAAFGKAAQWFAGGEETVSDSPSENGEATSDESAESTDAQFGNRDTTGDKPPRQHISPRLILEAMLFVGHPENDALPAASAAERMRGVTAEEIDELVEELNADYQARGCPYTIISTGGGYRLSLHDEFLALRDNFYGKVRQARLSQAAIDVLALVAYRQPLSREQVDDLRGRESAALLRQLVRRQLLRLQLPQEKGEPRLYFTTERFLKLFQLEDLKDLPQGEDVVGG